jgi:hypothetical protein
MALQPHKTFMKPPIQSILHFTGFCVLLVLLLQSCAEVFDLPTPTPPPRITAISPDSGAAGATITITGVHFSAKAEENAVKINGKIALITSANTTQLIATVPAHAGTGKVEVVVKSKATEGPDFVFFETPLISALSPTSGTPGTIVTITGKYFDTTATKNTVQFGGKTGVVNLPATDTLLTVEVPADAQTGEVTVTVNGITGTGPRFTVLGTGDPVLSITLIDPTSGTTGTVVTINGQNFGATIAENAVTFNGKSATVTAASPTQLKATVPAFAGTGLVSVTVKGKTASYSQFTYVWPTPVITTLDPGSGAAGSIVTLNGNNFFDGIPANNVVKFNGKTAVVNSATQTLIKAVVPADAGTGVVTVTVQGSTGNGPTFTYIDTSTPTITNYDPSSGKAGDLIAIAGTNFSTVTGNNSVKFNGLSATVTQASATLLNVTVPVGATTGAITVTVGTKTATGPLFTVIDDSPTITSFTPTSGPVSTGVTITGTHFGSDPAAAEIKFNGVLASPQAVTPTGIVTVVPQGATTGRITVTVNGKTGTSATDFIVTTVSANSWLATGSMNDARDGHTATLLNNGKVLVAGGIKRLGDGSNSTLGTCELYDPATEKWTATGSLSAENSRAYHTATLLADGKVLITGGYVESTQSILASSALYDPGTGQWTYPGILKEKRFQHTATLLPDGKVLVTGGNGNLASCELYDPATGQWAPTANLSNPYHSQHTATLLKNGKVLVVGGERTLACELYDPTAGTWSLAAALTQAASQHTAVLLPSGNVLISGGTGYQAPGYRMYDPANQWINSGNAFYQRAQHTTTLLPSGTALITGGEWLDTRHNGGGINAAELYNSTTNTVSLAASMISARARHTATLLSNGKVLVTGGSRSGNQGFGMSAADCELYTP